MTVEHSSSSSREYGVNTISGQSHALVTPPVLSSGKFNVPPELSIYEHQVIIVSRRTRSAKRQPSQNGYIPTLHILPR
eukprot:scaffold123833_cov47-Prasinocladus_malaysianus.AAC.1